MNGNDFAQFSFFQKSPHTDETQSASALKTVSAKATPMKFLSYNPSQVCFNPQYDSYFKNDLLSTSPVPKSNIYLNNRIESQVSCPKSPNRPSKNNFPAFVTPWPAGSLPGNYVPLVYIPTLPTGGHVDHRLIKYLKRLKDALDTNPLLASRNRTAELPKNHVEIKFGPFPSADALPVAFSKSIYNTEKRTAKRNALRIDEIKAQKMASYLKNYNQRRKKRENHGSNVYPLPKFVYDDHRIPEPTTFYNKNIFLAEIYNQNV
ncbi:hypothetical protein V9T40_009712 [Parthenolecanium corni]|uniref:Uncharacterized protein n=1 Tax=Parthenolecanium corni TaxID=536013 RepID=A0AAN9Y7T0_9HEMI